MDDKYTGSAGYTGLGQGASPATRMPAGVPEGRYTVEHDPDDLWDDSRVIINLGPTHPAMHGSFRMVAKINGETIEKSYCEFGYTHRAKEKLGENRTYHQFVVFTDRLNYCSALINNVAYSMAVEENGHRSAGALHLDPYDGLRNLAHHRSLDLHRNRRGRRRRFLLIPLRLSPAGRSVHLD
jgi:hypothetical protein